MWFWDLVKSWYLWMKSNDLPNWIILLFTAIFWPLLLFAWTKRKKRSIPNLQVSLDQCTVKMNGKDYQGVSFTFLNNTGSIVYLTNVELKKCSRHFPVDPHAFRDFVRLSHELKFFDEIEKKYIKRQITLQTNQEATTCIALSSLNDAVFSFRPSCLRRLIGIRKYFRLEYVAMVGSQRCRVSTTY